MALSERSEVILREYAALRSEQGRRFDSIDKMTNYILLMMLGISGFAVTISKEKVATDLVLAVVACLPIFFSPLVFDFLHNKLMVYRIGRYLHQALAREIGEEIRAQLLGWDDFNNREALRWFSMTTTVFRNFILILPIAVPMAIAFLVFRERPYWVNVLLGADTAVLAATIAVITYKGFYFLHVVNGRVARP